MSGEDSVRQGVNGDVPGSSSNHRSSSPASTRIVNSKTSSSSLSSQLSAHLSKPVALKPASIAPSSLANVTAAATSSVEKRSHVGLQQSGKAEASAADSEELGDSEVWKSNAAKRAEKAWALQSEKSLQSDLKFKKYTSSVEKCLATFESVSEWADFIAFLGRLLKTFQLSPTFNAIPRKLIVAKRLSQCLNPALPSGVHQRALDVYEHIFVIIGREGLRRDLLTWTPGLLPFFQYASTSVKPIVLSIFERHFLTLGQDLRPITRALVLATLPGLEEESSDLFDRVVRLLDRIMESVGQPFLLQNLFFILITSPSARLPALNYMAKRLPKLNGDDEDVDNGQSKNDYIHSIIGSDLGLLTRGFAAALEDDTFLLVRRASLDLLVTHLRLNSSTWKDLIKQDDKIRLVKAAIAVVLRRDLSLNRRLYVWILGPSEDIPVQQKYFEDHAQILSRLALLSELKKGPLMKVDNKEREIDGIERQKPFKIFVSLLDKWSIGQPLTNALILDTFQALQHQLSGIDDQIASHNAALKVAASDISTTAKMLFEVVDPFTTYRQFFLKIKDEMGSAPISMPFSSISLLQFVLKSFRVHDEESRQIHLPILFSSILELLSICKDKIIKVNAMKLAGTLHHLIPKRIFSRSIEQPIIEGQFVNHAMKFYTSDSYNADDAAQRYIGFQHPSTQNYLLKLCAEATQDEEVRNVSLQLLSEMLHNFGSVTDVSTEKNDSRLTWHARQWVQDTLSMIKSVDGFDQVEAYIVVLIELATCKALLKPLKFGKGGIAKAVYSKLFTFLHPSWSTCHVRAVDLLWSTSDLANDTQLELMLCQGFNSDDQIEREKSREILSAIWQYSPEERLADQCIKEPLVQILDGLQSTIWTEKQACEKWLKANLRGYTLYLDPLLQMITDAGICREAKDTEVMGTVLSLHQYTQPFDHERVLYALSVILQLVRFGAQSMMKSLRSTSVQRSHYPSILTYFGNDKAISSERTYLKALVSCLDLFLQSDCRMDEAYTQVYKTFHNISAEILQALMLRGTLPGSCIDEVEEALLQRTYISIHRCDLTIQTNLLQTLYGVIRAKTASEGNHRDQQPNPLLLIIIKEALYKKSNRSALSNWTEFILNMIPHYRRALMTHLLPLNDIVCKSMMAAIAELKEGYQKSSLNEGCSITDVELILIMNINERLLLQCLEAADHLSDNQNSTKSINATIPASSSAPLPPASSSSEKSESAGILGALNSVFPNENSTASAASTSPSNSVLSSLHHTIRSLHQVWSACSETSIDIDEARQRSLEVMNPKIKARCRRSLERIYRNNSGEVVESLIDCWNTAGGIKKIQGGSSVSFEAGVDLQGIEITFEILSNLAPSAQIVVTFLCDVISSRTSIISSSSGSEKGSSSQKKGFTPIVTENVLMYFWESYLDRLDAASMMQVWPVVIMLIRDILHNSTMHKLQMYPVLRCFTITGEKLFSGGNTNEDKKVKREYVDAYIRLCDYNILIAGRSFEQTNWIGRRVLTLTDDGIEQDSQTTPTTDEKMATSITDLSSSTATGSSSLIELINEYLYHRVLPALRKFNIDQDKIITLCTNIVYYIISPAIRSRRKMLEISNNILMLLTEVTRMPGTIRAWKNVAADVFQDHRFFQMSRDTGLQCLPIVLTLMNSDKERMIELIAKVTSTPSTNIFTNKEAETILRGTNLRRISSVIYAADRDQWLTHLPPLQEKLVELLRNGSSDSIGSDVYLCLRVLLMKFSTRHLTTFWPVVITELVKLFEECMDDGMPLDDSETLQLLLSACKFLDLLLTLQTSDFQLHQWLFITDTIDVVDPPRDWKSDSILDRMAIILSEKSGNKVKSAISKDSSNGGDSADTIQARDTEVSSVVASSLDGLLSEDDSSSIDTIKKVKRRPRLMHIGTTIYKVEELMPFFASISQYAFQQSFDYGDSVDWQAVNQFLEKDLFPNK